MQLCTFVEGCNRYLHIKYHLAEAGMRYSRANAGFEGLGGEIRDVPYDGCFGGGTDDGVDCDRFKGVTDHVVRKINDSAASFNTGGKHLM
eukprot:scaffold5432_cov49-Attheya_sp.AAC.3